MNGTTTEALNVVNEVRVRNKTTPLTTLTLQDTEEERARIFLWEGNRKKDMIHIGDYFTGTRPFKTRSTELFHKVFSIPTEQIIANPNLSQNDGYQNILFSHKQAILLVLF